MKVAQATQKVIERFGTNDVYEIALKSDIKIVYEDWYPTTIGEFDKKTKTICVNKRALFESKNAIRLEKIIIAHELGHFFAAEFNLENLSEEQFAHQFANEIVK